MYDAIVVGGGHNGLVNAGYLARAGLRTLVLEQRHLVGGAAITEELRPGFSFTTFSYALGLLRPQIIDDLDLRAHGYQPLRMPSSFTPSADGDHLLLTDDDEANAVEIARHSKADVEGMRRFKADLDAVCRLTRPLLDHAPADVFGDGATAGAGADGVDAAWLLGQLAGADRRTVHDFARLLTGSAADFLDDYFESDVVKASIASSGIIGSKVGPMSQGSGLVLLFHKMGELDGHFGSWVFHKGGNGGFTQVLARSAAALGAEIRLESPVDQVLVRDGAATGVVLADGTEISAPIVVSALDPRRTFTRLVDPDDLPDDLVDAVTRMRFQGTSAKVNFALDGLPSFPGLSGEEHLRGFINLGPTIEYLERAFDDAKYGWYSRRPFIDGAVQSVVDPDMAPPGKHVMSCFVQYAPYHLKGGDWDAEREPFGDTVQAVIEEHFPGFGDLVLQREVVTPLDIERVTGLTEGNIFAGEFLAPQMYFFRPAPGWSNYTTPIRGYYQCGSGTHPGGCVMGAPGKLGAERILADRT